jgi:3-oxoacyl-[acyl-carrier protein] reductase
MLLVTGGAGFIGGAVVAAALARGLPVRVLDSLRTDVHGEDGALPDGVEAVRGDVADPAAVAALFDASERLGPVHALVNNAGVMALSPLAKVEDAEFDRQMAVNLKGVFNGLREGARRLPEGGRIVSLSTSVVGTRLPAYGVYAATKAAVETMSHILAKELGPRGITVNVVAPGPVETELFLGGKDQATLDRMKGLIPLGRFGQPDDIAAAVAFLIGPDGGWVNGQVIRANGGMV